MESVIVERKLDSLYRCIARVEEKCPPDAGTLADDPDLQDILVLNLSRAVRLCVDIGTHLVAELDSPPPDTMGQTFDFLAGAELLSAELAARLKKSVGFRNLAVHNYEELNWAIVHAIASRHREDFREFARVVSARLDSA